MFEEFKLSVKDANIACYHWKPMVTEYVVCFIHGLGEFAARYDRVGEVFKAHGIAMVAMDLRGHGFSSGLRGHTAPRRRILSDLDQLMEQASEYYPGIPIVIYGHSMGGNIVLDYRRRGKFRDHAVAYIVTAPWLILNVKVPMRMKAAAKIFSLIRPSFQLSTNLNPEMFTNKKRSDIDNKEKSVLSDTKEERQSLAHGKISAGTFVESFRVSESLRDSRINKRVSANYKPLLLIQGEQDKICSREGSRRIKEIESDRCDYIEWEDLCHDIYRSENEEVSTQVLNTIIKWLKEPKLR